MACGRQQALCFQQNKSSDQTWPLFQPAGGVHNIYRKLASSSVNFQVHESVCTNSHAQASSEGDAVHMHMNKPPSPSLGTRVASCTCVCANKYKGCTCRWAQANTCCRGDSQVFSPSRQHSENKTGCHLPTWYVYSCWLCTVLHLHPHSVRVSHVGKAVTDSVAFHFAESHFIEQLEPAATAHLAHCNMAEKQRKASRTDVNWQKWSLSQPLPLLSFLFLSFLYYSWICLSEPARLQLPSSSNTRLTSVNILHWSIMFMSMTQDILFVPVYLLKACSLLICLTFGAGRRKELKGHVIRPGRQQPQNKKNNLSGCWTHWRYDWHSASQVHLIYYNQVSTESLEWIWRVWWWVCSY